jgi:predicted GNAT superfamily acetyltransferase
VPREATALQDLGLADLAQESIVGARLLALNNAHANELSWLDSDGFANLIGQAFLARRIGIDAFLLALDNEADYASPNFRWFRGRYESFVYVDRVVVAPAARGRGFARRLYEDLLEAARRAGHRRVVCEVNREPPNPASDAFHATLGFAEVGSAAIHGGSKTVRYLLKAIEP